MEFPSTIEGFGYHFNEDGELRQIENGKPFEFKVKNDGTYNQAHYEALGELITPYVYDLLEKRCGLVRHPVPVQVAKKSAQTFVFISPNFANAQKVLVLIHGSGVVRAGQWARSLIINDSLNSGTQIPFIERAIKEGYGVLVMNTNDNSSSRNGKNKVINGSEHPLSHGRYVWKNYVHPCASKRIAIVAHSYGGSVTMGIFPKFLKDFRERIFAVAFTDSFFTVPGECKHLFTIGRNWKTSSLPLDTPIMKGYTIGPSVDCVSAGCEKHEMTSWSSFESIFKFLDEKYIAFDQRVPEKPLKKIKKFLSQPFSSSEKKDVDGSPPQSGVERDSSMEVDDPEDERVSSDKKRKLQI